MGPGGRRGRMEVTVTLTRVTVGQHVDCGPLHSRLESRQEDRMYALLTLTGLSEVNHARSYLTPLILSPLPRNQYLSPLPHNQYLSPLPHNLTTNISHSLTSHTSPLTPRLSHLSHTSQPRLSHLPHTSHLTSTLPSTSHLTHNLASLIYLTPHT